MASYDTVRAILASSVANSGTFSVNYPDNRDSGDYQGGTRHEIISTKYGRQSVQNGKASFSFGTSSITITNSSGQAMDAGTEIRVQLDRWGADDETRVLANDDRMAYGRVVTINLGAPDTADPDGFVASQACTAAGGLATGINGALAVSGVGVADVPRNVVAAWTGTAVLTVTGTDEYGNTIRQSSASGTSLTGTKAFKRVTAISTSADITGLTVGTGDVLGLPVFLPQTGMVIKELQDGATATAGTLVAGVTSVASATTGDVRGTYDPNAACNGTRNFQLIAALDDTASRGVAQY